MIARCIGALRRLFQKSFSLVLLALASSSGAQNSDDIGLNALRLFDPTLTGSNVVVGQVEAGAPTWQVNPARISQPISLFTWVSSAGSSTEFPNALGQESDHASIVAMFFYGLFGGGVAPGVAHVYNYDSGFFYSGVVANNSSIPPRIINQSFIFGPTPSQTTADQTYDNYVANRNVLFVSGIGNGGNVNAPSTCYNGLAVAALGGLSSIGPTPDNGRSKPDLTAPASYTSYSTPRVAGAAALLLQAGDRGDGGAGTFPTATNAATIKALLLNGAIKPAGWTNGSIRPLDARHGAGSLNVYQSYLHLAGGKQTFVETTSQATGGQPGVGSNTLSLTTRRGWDYSNLSGMLSRDVVNHYYFELGPEPAFLATITLVWQRHAGQSSINNLDLVLRTTSDNQAVASSSSLVDNVEHLFLTHLAPGRYDLQVIKRGGVGNFVSQNEPYALAFEFVPQTLAITRAAESVTLSWPVSSAGFQLQTRSVNSTGMWETIDTSMVASNGMNCVATNFVADAVFRLFRPTP